MRSLFRGVAAGGAAAVMLALPTDASAQTGLLGGIGTIVENTTEELTSTLEDVLDGGDALLSTDTLDDVLVTVTSPPPGAPGTPGAPGLPGAPGTSPQPGAAGPGGATGGSGAGVTVVGMPSSDAVLNDRRAPNATVRVVSRLSQAARTRRLRLEVRSDEAGLVAFSTMVRPGFKRRGVPRRVKHRRSVIHLAPVVVAFRRPGAMTVDLRLRITDAIRLGRSRNGRMSVGILTVDVHRNQTSERLKRHLRR